MRQLLYVSVSLIGHDFDAFDRLLVQSRNNNGLYGVTGLLWTDGASFAQILEGHSEIIEDLIQQINSDSRHKDVVILQDSNVEQRQFGHWSMLKPVEDSEGDELVSLALKIANRAQSPLKSTFIKTINDRSKFARANS